MIIGLMTIAHAMIALDLVFRFFPATPEMLALWSVQGWVKALWFAVTILGVAAAVMLYRKPAVGFLVAVVLTTSIYFGAVGLWGELKGTFWVILFAAVLAAYGAWVARRSNNSFKPTSLRDAA